MRDVVQRSIDVVLIADGAPVAGQQGATLNRSMSPIDITNQITGSWKESLGGLMSWNISCNGMYIKDNAGLRALEQAFLENKEITVKILVGNIHYTGQALITNFPLNAVFNTQFNYTLSLLGTGELRLEHDTKH